MEKAKIIIRFRYTKSILFIGIKLGGGEENEFMNAGF